jgi:hypothetical protein
MRQLALSLASALWRLRFQPRAVVTNGLALASRARRSALFCVVLTRKKVPSNVRTLLEFQPSRKRVSARFPGIPPSPKPCPLNASSSALTTCPDYRSFHAHQIASLPFFLLSALSANPARLPRPPPLVSQTFDHFDGRCPKRSARRIHRLHLKPVQLRFRSSLGESRRSACVEEWSCAR